LTTDAPEFVEAVVAERVEIVPAVTVDPSGQSGGGHRKLGRSNETKQKRGVGYAHIHTAIDAYSRLAYSAFAGTENPMNCVAFLDRPSPGSQRRACRSNGS
jgi:hypothetical protein